MQPAMTPNGNRYWFTADRKLHRTDGPAVEFADGFTYWWLHDKSLSLDEYLDQNTELTDEEKVMMKLQYG
jgi:hypothetical protein